MTKFKVTPDRNYAPYLDVLDATNLLLDEFFRRSKWELKHKDNICKIPNYVKKNNMGSYSLKLSCSLTLACTIESFANSIGVTLYADWNNKERLSTKEKIKLICKKFNIGCDYGKYPFSEFKK
ncbi:MAG: hypothetical protein IJI37_05350, partial [Opitutales bacterium]|nr:hypothetical protein [Opitutales bacterium]